MFIWILRIEIWDAIHAAAEADIELAQAIVDSAGVIVHKPDMTVCYDESGITFLLISSPFISLYASLGCTVKPEAPCSQIFSYLQVPNTRYQDMC